MKVQRASGRISSGTMANEVSAAHFTAVLVALGAFVSALVLVTHTTVDGAGAMSRPFVGHAIAVGVVGIGLVAILLFLTAWAEAWRDAQL